MCRSMEDAYLDPIQKLELDAKNCTTVRKEKKSPSRLVITIWTSISVV